jgi:hypothetical protein
MCFWPYCPFNTMNPEIKRAHDRWFKWMKLNQILGKYFKWLMKLKFSKLNDITAYFWKETF